MLMPLTVTTKPGACCTTWTRRVKVVVTLAFILSNVLLPDGAWLAFALAWAYILALNVLSGLGRGSPSGVRSWRCRLRWRLPLPSSPSPVSRWRNGISASLTLIPTDAGLLRFVSIVIRSWLSVQAAILLVAVTHFPDLIHAFEHLRVPPILTTIVAFLYRYLFVLTDEVLRLLRARQARSAPRPGGGRAGASSGAGTWPATWQVSFSCAVTSAATASTTPCWRAAIPVTCARSTHTPYGPRLAGAGRRLIILLLMQWIGRL